MRATLTAKVDTGASGNILPLRIFRRMYPTKLNTGGCPAQITLVPTNAVLTACNRTKVQQCGTMTIPCCYRGKRNRPYSRRGHDGQKERLGLQIYCKFARQYVNCDATSLLLHVPVTQHHCSVAFRMTLYSRKRGLFSSFGSVNRVYYSTLGITLLLTRLVT